MKVLECYNIQKRIKDKIIINNTNLEIDEGEILGFIGKNGVGKTTMIKMILGLSKVNNGTIYINGYDISRNHDIAVRNVGAIIENPDMYMYLTGYQNLRLIANIYNLDKEDIRRVVKLVSLEDSIDKKINTYSLGMRQRLGIAAALLHNPKLLIFDEPFNGLDPIGVKDIKDIFMNLAYKENKSILVSSHILSELETFCNRICALKDSKIININKKLDTNIYEFKIDNTKKLNNINLKINIIDNNTFRLAGTNEQISELIKNISQYVNVYEVIKFKKSLEDIFLEKLEDNYDNVNI